MIREQPRPIYRVLFLKHGSTCLHRSPRRWRPWGCASNQLMVLPGTVCSSTRRTLHFLFIAACAALLSACGSTEITSTEPTAVNRCALTLASPQSPISATGGSQDVTVTTTRDCVWTASAEASWVARIDPATGQGSGTLHVQVAPNATPTARQTAIVVNNVRAQIQQLPAACDYAVSGSGS